MWVIFYCILVRSVTTIQSKDKETNNRRNAGKKKIKNERERLKETNKRRKERKKIDKQTIEGTGEK